MFMIGQIINKAYVFHLSNKGHQKKRNSNNFVWFLFCVQTNEHIIDTNKRNARVIFIFRAFWIIYWKRSPLIRVAFESCLFMHLIWLPENIHIDQPPRTNCGFRRQNAIDNTMTIIAQVDCHQIKTTFNNLFTHSCVHIEHEN